MKRRRIVGLLLLTMWVGTLAAATLPREMELDPCGSFSLAGIRFQLIVHDAKWNGFTNKQWDRPEGAIGPGGGTVTGELPLLSGRGQISETLTPATDGEFRIESVVRFDPEQKVNRLFAEFQLPCSACSITLDGKNLPVPNTFSSPVLARARIRQAILRGARAEELMVSSDGCEVEVQDNRQFGSDTVSVRFLFLPGAGNVAEAKLMLDVRFRRQRSQPVSLSGAVNRSYRDDSTRCPGWTGQGPDNDLRMFDARPFSCFGVPLAPDPAGTVACGGPRRAGLPAEVRLTLPENQGLRGLHLLHTTGWLPAGTLGEIEVRYANGERETLTLSGNSDCGDWSAPSGRRNAAVAWRGIRADGGGVGLYFSSFPLKYDAVRELIFRAKSPEVLWLVSAVTLGETPVLIPAVLPERRRIVAGREWVKLDFANHPVSGSAVDFSFLADAPAGKYGRVIVGPQGGLAFEKAPGKRIRFFGVNLCETANFPSHELADRMADDFVRNGYNAVRFHHHDNGLVARDSADSTTLDPQQLDRLEYFMAALRKRGIYYTTDLYTSRQFRPGDKIGEGKTVKAQLVALPEARENWKRFVRAWLTHRNPYTGLSLAEDPALILLNLVNEDNISYWWNFTPEDRLMFETRFSAWKKQAGCVDAAAVWSDPRFSAFLIDLQNRSLREMRDFVRNELGVTTLLTSLNMKTQAELTPMRDVFPVADNHIYQAHPGRAEARNFYSNRSALASPFDFPLLLAPSRLTGKPYWITEYCFCKPNPFRAEGGPLIGGYAAFQDWDGLFRFCYSHNVDRIATPHPALHSFESVNEPLQQLSDRIAAALFLRGDASPSPERFSWPVSAEAAPAELPGRLRPLALVAAVGSHPAGRRLPPEVKVLSDPNRYEAAGKLGPAWRQAAEHHIAVSSTGELKLDGNAGTFLVCTPRSESLTLPRGALNGNVLLIREAEGFQSVSAIALDGRELSSSRRLLLLHLTDVSNSEAEDESMGDRIFPIHQGVLPLLVRRARGKIGLSFPQAQSVSVMALSADGAERGPVRCVREKNGVWCFVADPGAYPGGVMAYEVRPIFP